MKRSVLAGVSRIAISLGAIGYVVSGTSAGAQVATAQVLQSPSQDSATPSEPEDFGTEIIVTAEKREESRKDVPLSVEVISGDALVEAGVSNGFDVVKFLPGFGLDASAEIRTTTLKTRGIGTLTNSIGLQSSNLLAVDDEVLSRQSAMNGAILDLERVEALRGPQGTLFGQNTSTGLIHYITKRPVIGENSGEIEANIAQYSEYGVRSVINLALNDAWAFRLNGAWSKSGAYIDNVSPSGDDIGENETAGVRGQAMYNPGTGFHALLRAEYSRTDTNCCAYVFLSQPTLDRYPALVITNGVPTISSLNRVSPQPFNPSRPVVAIDQSQYGIVDNFGMSGEIGLDLADNMSLTYAASYRDFTIDNNADTFNSVFPISRYNFSNLENTKTVQQELRLSSFGNDQLNWVVGLFYHDTKGKSISLNDRCTTGAGSTAQPRVVDGVLDGCFTAASTRAFVNNYNATGASNSALLVPDRRLDRANFETHFENIAIFGQATYNITNRLDVTLGGRLLRERSSAGFALETFRPARSGNGLDTLEDVISKVESGDTSLIRGAAGVVSSTGLEDTVSRFIYKAVLGYDITDAIRVYANYSTGFKGVSYFITSNTNPADGANLITRPERSTNLEFGFRSTLFDRKLAFNATVFDMTVSDYQLRATRVVDELSNTYFVGYVNAELARSRGVEIDITVRPVRNFSVYASFAYFDANFDKFANAPVTCPGGTLADRCFTAGGLSLIDQSGLPFPNNAEKQLFVSANYDIPIGFSGWDATVRGDYRWESDRTKNINQIAQELPPSEGQGIVDLYVGAHNERFKVQFFVKNLFNKFYTTEDVVNSIGEAQGFLARDYKRYVGGSASVKF